MAQNAAPQSPGVSGCKAPGPVEIAAFTPGPAALGPLEGAESFHVYLNNAECSTTVTHTRGAIMTDAPGVQPLQPMVWLESWQLSEVGCISDGQTDWEEPDFWSPGLGLR